MYDKYNMQWVMLYKKSFYQETLNQPFPMIKFNHSGYTNHDNLFTCIFIQRENFKEVG